MNDDDKKIREFTDLNAWKESHKVVLLTYAITKTFPRSEIFGLQSQMQRAVISITSNIAEGFGRQSYKEKIQFYYIAQGSLTELKNQYIAAKDIGYISVKEYEKILEQMNVAHKVLQGLITKSKTFINHK